jgi:hypothetical protein
MMKKTTLVLALFALTLAPLQAQTQTQTQAQAQDTGKQSWRKTGGHWERPNSITLTTSLFGATAYNGMAAPTFPVFNLEYDRMVYGNWSVSATGFYAKVGGDRATDTYTMRENFVFAGAKVNYNLPLLRNWLYLRTGIGAGVGIHDATDLSMGWPTDPPTPEPSPQKWVKAHGMVDMWLVFRATRWLELRVSPLLVSPSQFIFGSKFDAPHYNTTYFYWNPLGTLGLNVRF